jgi:hypothetical protein
VHKDATGGVTGVVQYPGWWLSASWTDDASARWGPFAAALDARESADGFLVIQPAVRGWKLGLPDAPQLQLGGGPYGSGAAFAFWGPDMYPAGCPTAAAGTVRTAEGWPVHLENGAWWCDPTQRVRVAAWNQALVDDAIQTMRVSYADAAHAVDRVTALDGSAFEVTAPSSVLDHLILQATVAVDGLTTPTPIVAEAARTPPSVHLEAGSLPPHSADAKAFREVRFAGGDIALQASYGNWTVDVVVTGAPDAARAQIASLFAAHETPDGFLVLDPRAPMHIVPGPAAEIVLDQVSIVTSLGEPRVEPARADVSVRRL